MLGKESKVFWQRYCFLEKEKTKEKKNWFELLKTIFSISGAFELIDSSEGEENFWNFYLNRSIVVNIALLILYMIFYIVISAAILGFPLGISRDPLFSHYSFLPIKQLPWFLFSFICLCFLIVHRWIPQGLKTLHLDPIRCWMGIGNSIICMKFVVLVIRLSRFSPGRECAAAAEINNPADQTFDYFALLMAIDVTAVVTFSVFPFPSRFNVYNCLIDWVSQTERLFSCGSRLILRRPEMEFLPGYLGGSLTFLYVIILTHSLVLEYSARRSFENTELQKSAVQEKRQIIHFLCFDTNHLMANFQSTFKVLHSMLRDGTEAQRLVERVEQNVQVVAAAVNEMMLMVRVEEQRQLSLPLRQSRDRVSLLELCSKVKHDLSQSFEQREALFEPVHEIVEETDVFVDQSCLEVLLRRLLGFTAHCYSLIPSLNESTAGGSEMEFRLRLRTSAEALPLFKLPERPKLPSSAHFVECSLCWAGTDFSRSINHEWKAESDTCSMICTRVLKSCGGYFISTSDSFCCLLPCKFVRTTSSENSEDVDLSLVSMCALVDTQCGVEVEDAVHVISSSLDCRIPSFSGSAVSMIERLVDYQVVFCDALIRCKEIREAGYTGHIVLVSGYHALLGNSNSPDFDSTAPIPMLNKDMIRLRRWLTSVISQGTIIPAGSEMNYSGNLGFVWTFFNTRWWEILVSFGMLQLPVERRESYLRWRAFNPSYSPFHHTKHLDLFMVGNILRVFLASFGAPNSETPWVGTMMSLAYLFLFRHWVFKYLLEPYNVSVMAVSRVIIFLYIYGNRVDRILKFLTPSVEFRDVITLNLKFSFPGKPDMPLDQLINEEKFGTLTFLQLLPIIISRIGVGKHVLIPFLWPAVPILAVLSNLIAFMYILALPSNLLTHQALYCALVFQLTSLVIDLVLIFNFEFLYRQEFTQLYDHILSYDMMQKSSTLCQPVIRRCLADMIECKSSLQRLLAQEVSKGRCPNSAVSDPIQTMHFSGLLIKELINELILYRKSLDDTQYEPQKAMFFLRNVVEDVIASFNSTSKDKMQLVVHAQLDSRLSVVRFDMELFVTILTSCLVMARKRLRMVMARTGHSRENDIFVDIRVLETPERVYRFAEARKLLVIVADGAIKDLATKTHSSELPTAVVSPSASFLEELESGVVSTSFSQSVCEQFTCGLGDFSFYDTGSLEHIQYSSFTRFTFPYQLTLDSHTASEAVKKGDGLLILTQDNTTEELLLSLQRMESLAGTMKMNRNAKTLQPLRRFPDFVRLKNNGSCNRILFITPLEQGEYIDSFLDGMERFGWVFTLVYTPQQYDFKGVVEYDCVMVDTCTEYEWRFEIREFVIKLRAHGFRKLVAALTMTLPTSANSADVSPVVGAGGVCGWDNRMSVVHEPSLGGVDFTVCLPVVARMAVELFLAVEGRLASLLLNRHDNCIGFQER